MPKRFDEISLSFWENNKIKIGSSKSYTCVHDGYFYGDDMKYSSIEFIYYENGIETVIKGRNNGPKWAYFELVKNACSKSQITFNNFKNNQAEKFRIYSKNQVALFTEQKKNSTRIRDESCKIKVNESDYYVANNLKVCEYFNSAATNIDPNELDKWFIRIYFDDDVVEGMTDRDEVETFDSQLKTYTLNVNSIPTDIRTSGIKHRNNSFVNIDFQALNMSKKNIGDLGELIAVEYERQKLNNLGRSDLALRVEHVSVTKGDGLGYDILSFDENGIEVYIEVKTTKQNKPDGFYLSRKEKLVADEKTKDNMSYMVYRIYKLNTHSGEGNLVIYKAPFNNKKYEMEPENWLVKIKS